MPTLLILQSPRVRTEKRYGPRPLQLVSVSALRNDVWSDSKLHLTKRAME